MYIADGLKVTLLVTFFAVIVGIILGFLVAVVRSTYDKTGKLKLNSEQIYPVTTATYLHPYLLLTKLLKLTLL